MTFQEDDKRLNADDASKTLDILQRQMNQVRQDLFETAQQVRGFNCGQDRYQVSVCLVKELFHVLFFPLLFLLPEFCVCCWLFLFKCFLY